MAGFSSAVSIVPGSVPVLVVLTVIVRVIVVRLPALSVARIRNVDGQRGRRPGGGDGRAGDLDGVGA